MPRHEPRPRRLPSRHRATVRRPEASGSGSARRGPARRGRKAARTSRRSRRRSCVRPNDSYCGSLASDDRSLHGVGGERLRPLALGGVAGDDAEPRDEEPGCSRHCSLSILVTWATSSATPRGGGWTTSLRWPSAFGRGRSGSSSGRSTSSGPAGPTARDRERPRPFDDPVRAARLRKDDAGADHRADDGLGFRRAVGGVGDGGERPRSPWRAHVSDSARTAAGRSSSSTRSTASTRPSRTPCCQASRKAC